uniref:Angiogenic factor with G patch and FHA domains 1 n=1 Tax=Pyxicephalus adspersus TaxID=30357 RepID=A0AAV2ZY38_PYXAD|nr:TPA: hypothetical protein GDO54_014402 [Pyxicephalus adspersus]
MEEEVTLEDNVPVPAQIFTKVNEESGAPCAEPTLYLRVQALEEELRSCQEELSTIQRQLSHSQRLHHTAESTNQELRRQSHPAEVTPEASAADVQQSPRTDDTPSAGGEQETGYGQHVAGEEETSLAESLRATAEAALSQTGFTYDENTGMYYDHSTGFYYDSESQLYYDPSTGIYYYCDVESGRYQFHSRVDLQAYMDSNTQPIKEKKGRKKKREPVSAQEEDRASEMKESFPCSTDHERVCPYEREESTSGNKKLKLSSQVAESSTRDSSSSVDDSEPEEGELTDSEKTSSDEEMSSADSTSTLNSDTEDAEQIWPPCIRVIVVRSPVLQKGSLFIITAVKSATIGREKDMGHTIRIPEVGVSKFHAEVHFDHNLQSYVLVDQGSQNGTVINGNQILQPKTVGEPYVLHHGDEVKFGETVLSFHVHPGSETCDGCEPGQVRAHLRLNQKEEGSVGPLLSKEEKEMLRRRGLKKIREKYGLQGVDYEDNKVLKNPKYKDRASRRREVVGSEGTFQKEDAPASVHIEISDSNKGRKMLEKMGWKKGEGLGKTGDGMRDPIQLQLHKKQAGLGAHNATSIEDVQSPSNNKKKNWEKARERYAENFQDDNKPKTQKTPSWVRSSQ